MDAPRPVTRWFEQIIVCDSAVVDHLKQHPISKRRCSARPNRKNDINKIPIEDGKGGKNSESCVRSQAIVELNAAINHKRRATRDTPLALGLRSRSAAPEQ
jgi:hypothetical protein